MGAGGFSFQHVEAKCLIVHQRKLDVLGYSDKSDTFWTCLGATLPQSLVCALLVGGGGETKPKESSSCCENFCFYPPTEDRRTTAQCWVKLCHFV